MRILIDTKNLALYGGGIAQWFAPLLAAWLEHRPDAHFQLLSPDFQKGFLPHTGNWEHVPLAWPEWLPRPLRHPWYDNVLFPRAVAQLKPDLIMSPYHDVRMPRGIPFVIGVHDLCLDEMVGIYPARIRHYYLALLRRNLRLAASVITVSETSRQKLVERYRVPVERISVIYNADTHHFETAGTETLSVFKDIHGLDGRYILYSGGSEYRKNVERLAQAFASLAQAESNLALLVTGNADDRWQAALSSIPACARSRVRFAGRLSDCELRVAYAAADAVVYPSLCEGFGRVCLESMEAGAPLACSDLSVMREVAADYASYFDPYDINSIAKGVASALAQGRRKPVITPRFQSAAVKASFLELDWVASDRYLRSKA